MALELQSSGEGHFIAPYLTPGRYSVEVSAAGFRRAVQPGVVVQINDRIELNLSLEVGATAAAVRSRSRHSYGGRGAGVQDRHDHV